MMRRELEDVPELMQRIQSRLPVEAAARTSVLSKSWLHAWSTIPTLRFYVRSAETGKSMKLVNVDRTLIRYLRDNIPIKRFVLKIGIENQESASHAEKWIGPLATKTCLTEFSLSIFHDGATSFSFSLPDELLLGEKLTKIRFLTTVGPDFSVRMTTSLHPLIKCVSLRELRLNGVRISEEALNHILSSCRLLEEIELISINSDSCDDYKGFKTIKVINLHRLYELSITLAFWQSTSLEISDVPNLGVFRYELPVPFNASTHSMSLTNLTQLKLRGVVRDNACLDMIKSGSPFLESLTLEMTTWISESFHFTCASLKILSLQDCPHKKSLDIQIYAPKLRLFAFGGNNIMPNLLFPVSSLRKIELSLTLDHPLDVSIFLKMREALMLSRKCDLRITTFCDHSYRLPLDINIHDLRSRLLFPPATNVQQLEFKTDRDECMWERSPFFDAFFEICHPKRVIALPDMLFRHNNHFCRLMLREVLDKEKTTAFWPQHLKHVLIRRLPHQKWKTLKRSLLHESAPVHFKLKWR